MASSLDAKIKDICEQMVALKNHTDSLDRHTDLYAMKDICDLIRPGEGLLESIPEPVGVTTAAPADDSDTEEKGATTQAKDGNKNRVKKFDDGPNRKRKLGEDRTLSFLQALESEIVSGSQELEVVQRLVLMVCLTGHEVRHGRDGTSFVSSQSYRPVLSPVPRCSTGC